MFPELSTEDGENELRILLDILIPQAQLRFDGGLRDSDAADTKALGTLASDAAALGAIVGVHNLVNSYWWLPAIGSILAGGLLIASIWPRGFDLGPDLAVFYAEMAGGSPLEAARQMLSELLLAISNNQKDSKILLLWGALILMLVSLLGCLPVVFLRPHLG